MHCRTRRRKPPRKASRDRNHPTSLNRLHRVGGKAMCCLTCRLPIKNYPQYRRLGSRSERSQEAPSRNGHPTLLCGRGTPIQRRRRQGGRPVHSGESAVDICGLWNISPFFGGSACTHETPIPMGNTRALVVMRKAHLRPSGPSDSEARCWLCEKRSHNRT